MERLHFFARPLPPGHVYPCTVEDLRRHVARLPSADLSGLWAVGLVPATRKERAYGYYQSGCRPYIALCSRPASLEFRLWSREKRRRIEHFYRMELFYGLRIERAQDVWTGRWEADGLRRFALEYLLLHEVGHHVYYLRHPRRRYPTSASELNHERFANAYAHRQRLRLAGPEGPYRRLASPPRYQCLPGYSRRGGRRR